MFSATHLPCVITLYKLHLLFKKTGFWALNIAKNSLLRLFQQFLLGPQIQPRPNLDNLVIELHFIKHVLANLGFGKM